MSTIIDPRKPTLTPGVETDGGGLIASFDSVRNVLDAVKALRSKDYERIDVHSPHPIHGLDDALGLKGSPLPWGAIAGAVTGLGGGLWMAWWMNAVDYPFIISGKPMFSVIPSLPVAFELAILFAAFAVFFGAIFFGGMPRLSNPKFRVPGFARATNDRYLLAVDSADGQFLLEDTRDFLKQLGGQDVVSIPPVKAIDRQVPKTFWAAAAILFVLGLIPLAMIAKARNSTSTVPRLSFVSDMDHQPKFKAQTTSSLFADGRAMRPQVAGTIALGDLREDHRFYLGRRQPLTDASMESRAARQTRDQANAQIAFEADNQTQAKLGAFISDTDVFGCDEAPQEDQQPEDTVSEVDEGEANNPPPASQSMPPTENYDEWVTAFPLEVDEALIRRGKIRYEIFCATCHGQAGDGDGLVTLRALELEQGTWVKPTSLHDEIIRRQPVGFLFNTISNGIRKMPGYASQIPVKDRWAIVAYMRALQRTRTATASDVPDDVLPTMRELR